MFDVLILLAIASFVLFLYLLYRAVKLFVKFVAFVGLSALFPIIAVKVFGVNWDLTAELIVSFAMLGVLGFFVYYGLSLLEALTRSVVDSSKDTLGVDKKRRRGE